MADAGDAQRIPKRALYKGKVVRISHYEGDGWFVIYDRYDNKITTKRDRLTMLPDAKTTQRNT